MQTLRIVKFYLCVCVCVFKREEGINKKEKERLQATDDKGRNERHLLATT